MSRGYQNQSIDMNSLFSSMLNPVTFGSSGQGPSFCDGRNSEGRNARQSQSREGLRGKREDWDEREVQNIGNSHSPSKLFECRAEIVLYQEMLRCGILQVHGPGSQSFYCFFLEVHCVGQLVLKEGYPVMANIRLMNSGAKVSYMAASVWKQGERVSESVMDILASTQAHQEDIEKYVRFSDDIAFGLDDIGVRTETSSGSERRRSNKRSPTNETDRRGISPKRSRVGEVDIGTKFNFNTTPPFETLKPSNRTSFAASNITEEFPEYGVRAMVDKYLTSHTGQLSLINSNNKKTDQVLFHVNQVWMVHAFGHSHYLETHSVKDLNVLLGIGATVNVNARKISGCNYKYQATAIWTTKDQPPNYKTVELLADLSLHLNDYIFAQTEDPKFLTNPLAGAPDCVVSAKVQEYFCQEMGFLQLDSGDRGVVLFHLNQVWTEGDKKVLYKTVQDKILQTYIPIGSSVMVNLKKLPASPTSSLRYQATLVTKKQPDDSLSQRIPTEYIERYTPHNERLNLVKELENYHAGMKGMLNLNKSVFDSKFTPVHAVLNGLPDKWMAEVVAAVSDEFGIIKISHQSGNQIGPRVHTLYAMFHVEDVFDAHGVPAILSPNISMKNLLNCHVDLTARPICTKSEPEKILEMQYRLTEEHRDYSAIPLLQAIVVCVKMSTVSPINFTSIPKPTRLRDHPGSFGQKLTEFYLNASLGCKLDIKLKKFLAIPNKLNLPYERVMKKMSRVGRIDQKNILNEFNKINVNNSSKCLYGELPKVLPKLDKNIMPHSLPKILTNQKVKPLYLHRTMFKSDCGIVELELEISVDFSYHRVKTLAFFELSRYKFFTPPDFFATDLANIMPIFSEDNFYIHAQLAFPDSDIPYVALAIWNENLRRDIGADFPMDFRHDQRYGESCQNIITEITSISIPEKSKEESGNEFVPSFLPIPNRIGTVTQDVKQFDKTKVLMDHGQIQAIINSKTGVIDRVLSDHIAILTFKKRDKGIQEFRVLCSSDDIFILDIKKEKNMSNEDFKILNKVRFSSANELWNKTARSQKISLFSLLKPGQEVRLNVVPLLSNTSNEAGVHYCSAGVLVTKDFQTIPVPVNCVGSSKDFTDEFKIYFMKVLRNLNKLGKLEGDIGKKIPPEKIPASLKKGKQGRMSLRPEYMTCNISKPTLPNPVRAKKATPKPIVWEKIINDFNGKVIRIIDKNYGIGAGYVPIGSDTTECVPFQILFDTFDVYIDDEECNELGKKLSDVMEVGDFIKFNAVHISSKAEDSARDIKYMTTAMVVAKTADELKTTHIPETAARILSLDQVTPTKVENFKVVVGVMNSTNMNEIEETLLEELRSGRVATEFSVRPAQIELPDDGVVAVDDDSDDEVTVIGDDTEEDLHEKSKIINEFTPSELRKLIMCYMEAVTKLAENKTKSKVNLEEIAKNAKIEKEKSLFDNFFLYLGQQCRFAIKGVKIGHVFVTQTQVNLIKSRGVMNREDIQTSDDSTAKIEENICSLFSAQDLRKILLNFMKLIQNTITLEQLCTVGDISDEEHIQVLEEITEACRNAPKDEGKAKGIKMQNIFINATWVDKISKYNFNKK